MTWLFILTRSNTYRILCGTVRVSPGVKMGGNCIFTIPIIVDRMSRDRAGLGPSYHGSPDVPAEDQIVFTEFGVDFWKMVLGAGFRFCGLQAFEYPAALAVVASK